MTITDRSEETLLLTLVRTWSEELCLINTEPINFDPSLMTVASCPSLELNYFEIAQKVLKRLSQKPHKIFLTSSYP